ncbi:MAG TPA: crossover junction endodeoxyribonuclease RuvC [Verrucomicrobiae bacterium]|nr:crossover junction endodeoxyribonuclease RuvC [Verrucomicrobiae bacterium]
MSISPRQFEQMQNRVSGVGRTPASVLEPGHMQGPAPARQVILGIDPSLRGTGYGVLQVDRKQARVLAQGTIKASPNWERSRCLVQITHALRDIIRQFRPGVCVVEGLFYAQNIQTALIMGEARGASLVAAGEAGLEIYELAPRKVKQAIVGYGAAQKPAVAKMVQRRLGLSELPLPDAADALALALTYAQENGRYSLAPPRRI